jgi:hypothetical protein
MMASELLGLGDGEEEPCLYPPGVLKVQVNGLWSAELCVRCRWWMTDHETIPVWARPDATFAGFSMDYSRTHPRHLEVMAHELPSRT